MHPARRLWLVLEPLHDVAYFTPGVPESGVSLGLPEPWMTYFAYRAAPLGPVGSGAVLAAFAGFEPTTVAGALPAVWTWASPRTCLASRLEVCTAALRAYGAPESAYAEAVEVLAPVLAAADPTGRPMFAANAALPLPDDPVGALWQLATTLREHRGDGHVAALVACGVSGLEALLLQVGRGVLPGEVARAVRGWSAAEWSAAAEGLRERGVLAEDGALTPAGSALLDEVEDRTDAASWRGCLARLGEPGVERVAAVLSPAVEAMRAAGVLPEPGPTRPVALLTSS